MNILLEHSSERTESPLTNEHCENERKMRTPIVGGNGGEGETEWKKFMVLIFFHSILCSLFFLKTSKGSDLSSGFSYYLWFPKLTKLWLWQRARNVGREGGNEVFYFMLVVHKNIKLFGEKLLLFFCLYFTIATSIVSLESCFANEILN